MYNDLKKLNEGTFIAEEHRTVEGLEWDAFLNRVLSDDFRIRRSRPTIPLQDRNEMIAHIRKDKDPAKRQVDKVVIVEDGNYGVVTSIVTLEGQPDRFHNIKVFFRQSSSGDWQCTYWQVSKLSNSAYTVSIDWSRS